MRKLTSQDFSIVYWRKNCAIINFLCYFVALFAVCCSTSCSRFGSAVCQTMSTLLLRIIRYFAAASWPSFLLLFMLPLAATFLIFCNICHVFLLLFLPAAFFRKTVHKCENFSFLCLRLSLSPSVPLSFAWVDKYAIQDTKEAHSECSQYSPTAVKCSFRRSSLLVWQDNRAYVIIMVFTTYT